MKAITFLTPGGPEVLQQIEIEIPTPAPNQLLIQVKATALNRADCLQRKGIYPPPPGESSILGLEIAGIVVAQGIQVLGNWVGKNVFGLVGSGGYAEYCLIDYKMAIAMPNEWNFEYAASIPEAFITAHETLFHLARLSPQESVLIHAGASGVGMAALSMALYRGIQCYYTAGSEEKIHKVKQLYPQAHGINYKTTSFIKSLQDLTHNQGIDVIADFIGAPYISNHLHLLKPQGRLLCIALMGGYKCEIDLRPILQKRLHLIGFILRTQSIDNKRAITDRFVKNWMPVLQSNAVQSVIDSVYPLEHVKKAHEKMENNLNIGKIILKI